MKKLNSIYIVLLLGLLFNLTGCSGYYPCTSRLIENENYIEDTAIEYELNDFETFYIQYEGVKNLYSFLDKPQGLEADRDFVMLVAWEENTVSILTMSVCTEYDTLFVEREFPALSDIDTIVNGYLKNEAITLSNEDPLYESSFKSPYQFIHSFQHENYIHPLMYKVGSYLEDDDTKELFIIEKEEGLFSLISIHYGFDESVNKNQMIYNELSTFYFSDLSDDNTISLCKNTECIDIALEDEAK